MQYTLTLSTEQAQTANKAIDLLMRLKIGQFDRIPDAVQDWTEDVDAFCRRRDKAEPLLNALWTVFKPYNKDKEWHRLYDLHQVIRKAIHDAEYPETKGVDSYPVMCTAGEKMARMEVSGDESLGRD